MDLITAELKALNNRCEQLELNKESLNNEINLLNKLLFCEQKYIKHLNDLLVFYEKNLTSNNRYFHIKEINDNKIIAKQNELELNKLKTELIDWRKENNRFRNDIQKSDHTYSSKNNNKNIEVLKTSNEKSIVKHSKNSATNCSLLKSKTDKTKPIIIRNNFSISETLNTNQPKESSIPIQLEIIPKSEPLSDAETESSSEAEDFQSKDNESNNNNKNNNSFLLVSEYLSKTKDFCHYLNKNDDRSDGKEVNEQNPIGKAIAIDLNRESDQDSIQEVINNNNINSIFDDQVIDLTPKKSVKKSSAKSNSKTSVKSKQLKKKKSEGKKEKVIKKTETGVKPKEVKTKQIIINKANEKTNKTIKIAFSGDTYYCKWNSCSYSSVLRCNAIRHYRTHTGEKLYECNLCTKQFTNKRSLKTHSMAHNTGKRFALRSKIISELSQKVKTNNQNKKQIKRNINGGGNLLCPISKCDRKYYEFSHLMRHLNQNHGHKKAEQFKKEYYKQKQVICNKIVITKSCDNSKNKTKPIVKECEKRLSQSPKSMARKRSLIDENEKQWKCDYDSCERSYFEKHNLKRHQLEVHKKLSKVLFKGHKTNADVKYFNPPKVCINNIDINQNEMTQTFVCETNGCNKSFQSHSGLYRHQKTKHLLDKIQTPVKKTDEKANCESPRVSESSIDNKPSLTREWICEIANCGSRYIYKQNLKRHMKEHHSLPDDQQSIELNSSLNIPKEKYECTYDSCGFFTFIKRSLIVHYKTHFESDNKPFKCLITDCNYSIDALHKLKNHVLNKHSEQQFFRAMEATGVHYPVW